MPKTNTPRGIHKLYKACTGISTDSRHILPGSMFFALRGANFDGNDFALQALEDGAKYVIVSRDLGRRDARIIRVDDTLATLQGLATYHHSDLRTPVLAITGTNGKTTTKELITAVLSRKYDILATEGNLNNNIGVPLTLLRLTPEHRFVVLEMGASHPGDIAELCHIAQPTAGLITNVGKAHLAGFGSFEGVIKTKCELFNYLRNRQLPFYLNQYNQFLASAVGDYRNAVRFPTDIELTPGGETLCYHWKFGNVTTHLVGDYNFENVLAAVAVGRRYMVSEDIIHQAIADYVPTNNRSQKIVTDHNVVIADTYNANPTSMTAAINNFYNMPAEGLKVAILGDMRELGAESEAEHRTIIEKLRNSRVQRILLVGEEFCRAFNSIEPTRFPAGVFTAFATRKELEAQLSRHPLHDCTILVKGSHSMGLEKIIPLL